ncbi:hypothetical protein ABEB36_001832 [Hypothenemus hampei]|uniref:U6 snRNA phosphodiesterase n=1 Tax=Hypothenemus hampei TaxID=57062 RepID=A0ABD1FFW3_HYPHA
MFQKNALALISEYYSGDTSDEETVPGPRVSTKRSLNNVEKEEQQHERRLLKQQRLPIPAHFTYPKNNDRSMQMQDSNPSLHDGRIRSFPHERGNWATFVYIPFDMTIGIEELCTYIKSSIPKAMDLRICEDFHLSLTRTVILKHHWIESFVATIRQYLNGFKKFFIFVDCIQVYCNDERTRTFLAMQVESGYDTLQSLVRVMDQTMTEYELPTFYKNASFHVSIAWCVGDHQQELTSHIQGLNEKLACLRQRYDQSHWYMFVESVHCKIGNKQFQFALI